MPQLEHIEAIEKRLWSAADNLRPNSNYASNEYFLPVTVLIDARNVYRKVTRKFYDFSPEQQQNLLVTHVPDDIIYGAAYMKQQLGRVRALMLDKKMRD